MADRQTPTAALTFSLADRGRFAWHAIFCRLLGHDWYECEPECCGQTVCYRCAEVKP